jgi:hypothetical protein
MASNLNGMLYAAKTQRELVIIAKVETLPTSWDLMPQAEEKRLRTG